MDSDLERRIARLEAMLPVGTGVSTVGGQSEIRAMQVGFPAITTELYDATLGYAWSQLHLDNTVPLVKSPDVPLTGNQAFTPDNNLTLPIGTVGFLEPDQQAVGWILVVGSALNFIRLPIRLTSVFSATTGYDWQLLMIDVSTQSYVTASPALTGNKLVAVDNDQTLQPGRQAIMWPDPTVAGQWMFQLWPLPLVGAVCPIYTSGVISGIEVETWQSEPNAGTVICTDNPDDCCPPPPLVTIPCLSPPCSIPQSLYLTLVGAAGVIAIVPVTYQTPAFADGMTAGWTGCWTPAACPPGYTAATGPYVFGIVCGNTACDGTPGNQMSLSFSGASCGTPATMTFDCCLTVTSCSPFCAVGACLSGDFANPFLLCENESSSILTQVTSFILSDNPDGVCGVGIASRGKAPTEPNRFQSPPCIHRGGLTTPPEKATKNTQWVECRHTMHPLKTIEDPTGAKVCGCVGCGPTCTGYAVAVPDRIRKIDLGTGRIYNSSLLRFKGKLLLVSRNGYPISTLSVAVLGEDFSPVAFMPLTLNHPDCAQGQDDPRLFIFQDRPHLEFTGVSFGPTGPRRITVLLARLRDDLTVETVWQPTYARHANQEKNWMPFEFEGRLLGVYSTAPHRIIEFKDGIAADVYETPGPSPWPGRHFRGGCPPVRKGDEFYSFFHTQQRTAAGTFYYTTGCYTFEAKPPFRATRCTQGSIWQPDSAEQHLNGANPVDVIYPCGAILENGKWFVSAGHQDTDTLIAEFSAEKIEGLLVKIT